ncbi:MAG: hypothetical protein JJE04_23100 [Acidobacteriia bacterium]|nr:hypothetical protein [Terriglobia bacterium]
MAHKITRRGWAARLTTSALATSTLAAQTTTAPETAEELLEAARRQARRNLETLSKFPLPMAVEPSYRFEAA